MAGSCSQEQLNSSVPKISVTTHPLDFLEGKVTAHSLDEIRGIKPSATGSVLLVR